MSAPDGATIAVAGDDTRRSRVTDGKRLASGGNDNIAIIWDSEHGDSLLDLHRHTA